MYRGRTLDGRAVEVAVEGARIARVAEISPGDWPLIAPPLVDLQQNGALGMAFNDLCGRGETLGPIAAFVRRHGVGRMMATFTTADFESQRRSLRELDGRLSADADLARLFVGVFYEGNYMSREPGWRGIHPAQFMRDPNWPEWQKLQQAAGGRIRLFNVDPMLPGAIETIRQAVAAGVRVAMGHCGPTAEAIRLAANAGADIVTHFGNGIAPIIHRHHNPLWAWLADDRLALGIIADGYHLPEEVIRVVFKVKPREKVFTVSDAAAASGSPPGDYGSFVIEPNGRCHQKDEDVLAGNWFQADRCVERLCEMGWPLAEAWRQQSEIPARLFHLPLPALAPGQEAEFVLARFDERRGLQLEQVVALGSELLKAPVGTRTVDFRG
jgi:N-acetylglucosamine-6-phosphate deacetylase